MTVHPQVRAILDAQAAAGMPSFAQMEPAQARALMEAVRAAAPARPSIALDAVEDLTVPGPAGPIPIRRYRPDDAAPTGRIVYFHGGGWVVGTIETSDGICRLLTSVSGCEIWSVDYRLAPEAPFPAGVEDGWAVLGQAAAEADRLPLLVGGDSAGGNIAASLTLRARDAGGPAIAGQVLFYPVTDHDLDRPSYVEHGAGGLMLTRADMDWFWTHYAGDPVARGDPAASVLRAAHHRDLPPAHVVVAGYDPLHDEGVAYAEALDAGGNAVVLRDHPDMIHGFCAFVGIVETANAAVDEAGRWVRTLLATGR